MAELSPRTSFAGLRIDAVAGRGGMGVVYRATDPSLGRSVALKVIAEGLLGEAAARERFVRESRAAAAIEHPNVIPIYSAGEQDGVAYIVMRFVDGDDLLERIRRDGALDPASAAQVVARVGSALDAAHAAGLVHRDVKPANILLGPGDHAYLTDFGLARHAVSEAGITRTGAWVGTLDYVAPEQIQGARTDGRADVYALGCVLYFALTGTVPFRRDSDEARLWAHVHATPPAPSRDAPGVPPAFDSVIAAALAKRPEDRFQSAGELGEAALAAASGRAATRRVVPPQEGQTTIAATAPPRPRRRPLLLAGAALALLAGVVAAVALAGGDGDEQDAGTAQRTGATTAERRAALPPAGEPVAVGDQPNEVELAGGNLWVTTLAARRLGRLDRASGKARRGPAVGRGARDLVAVGDELWVTIARQRRVMRLSGRDGSTAAPPITLTGRARQIDAGEGAVWVADVAGGEAADTLVRLDPETGAVEGRTVVQEGITDVRAAAGAVWVVTRHTPLLLKLDPATGREVLRRELQPEPLRVDVGAGYVWVTVHGDNTVVRIDPRSGEAVPIAVPSKPFGIEAHRGGIWITCYGDHSLVRIDPATSRVSGAPRPVGLNPIGVAADGTSVWVASRAEDSVMRLDAR